MDASQIIVHITATCDRRHDEKYREQVDALERFDEAIARAEKGPQDINSDSIGSAGHSSRTESDGPDGLEDEHGEGQRAAQSSFRTNEIIVIVSSQRKEDRNVGGSIGHGETQEASMLGQEVGRMTSTPHIESSTASDRQHDSSPCTRSKRPCVLVSAIANGEPIVILSSSNSSEPSSPAHEEVSASSTKRGQQGDLKRKHDAIAITPMLSSAGKPHSRRSDHHTKSSSISHISETPIRRTSISSSAFQPSGASTGSLGGQRPHKRPRTAPEATRNSPALQVAPLRRSRSTTSSIETPLSVMFDSRPPYQPRSTSLDPVSTMNGAHHLSPGAEGGGSSADVLPIPLPLLPAPPIHSSSDDNAPRPTHSPAPPISPSPNLHPVSSPQSGHDSSTSPPLPYGSPLNVFARLGYDIDAPIPPPGTNASFTGTPRGLASIERGLLRGRPLHTVFVPVEQIRQLCPSERGHWEFTVHLSFDAPSTNQDGSIVAPWASETFINFYDFLYLLITSGRAGHSIRVRRDSAFQSTDGAVWDVYGFRTEVIRVFCAGGLAESVWLAIVLASRGQAGGLEAVWRDGGDLVVIQM